MGDLNAAILLIEFQKTWTERGFFHKLIQQQYLQKDVLSNTLNFLKHARASGITIIQAPLILDKADKSHYKKTPFPARLFGCFTKGTWKAEFSSGIYQRQDIVIQGRYGFDACKGSDLEEILHLNKIKKVYLCGFTTDHCIKETIESLERKGFKCVLVSDCTATRNAKLQQSIEAGREVVISSEVTTF